MTYDINSVKNRNDQPYEGEIIIHTAIIEEVSLYPNALDAIREYICNGWDADAERIDITIQTNRLVIEDWGTGITNFTRFWGIADQHKSEIEYTPKYKRKPVGRKGLGKLSYSMLGNNIDVETRTKNSATYSYANFSSRRFKAIPRTNINEVLSHTGTQITIKDLKVELKEEDVIKYIKQNLYGLILPIACKEHPLTIFVNEKKVTPTLFTGLQGVIQTEFGDIHCNLTPAKTTRIDALYRGVKVKEVNPAPTHPAKGYFNVDWLIPTSDRSNFVGSKDKNTFFRSIHEWILRNIPVKNEDNPRNLEKSLKDVAKLFDQTLMESGIMPENMLPTTKTAKPSDLKLGGVTEQNNSEENPESYESDLKQERQRHQHKILKGSEKPLKSAFGIYYVFRKEGKLKPAVIPFKDEKLIVINRDHELIKNVDKRRPLEKSIALVFLIARGLSHILETFETIASYDTYSDDMVSTVLSKMVRD